MFITTEYGLSRWIILWYSRVLNCGFGGCHGTNIACNDAHWQTSPKLMWSRFLPLLTPVVFTACLSSGRLRPDRERERESREWGRPPIFMTLQFLPQTHSSLQSCFHFARLHVMLLKLKQTALNGSNENDFALAGLWSRHVNSLQRFTAHTVLTQTVQGPNSCTWSAEE